MDEWNPAGKILLACDLAEMGYRIMECIRGSGTVPTRLHNETRVKPLRDNRAIIISNGPHRGNNASISRQQHACSEVNRFFG